MQKPLSMKLGQRLTTMIQGGRRLNDDSVYTEGILNDAMNEILPYAMEKCKALNMETSIEHKKRISLFECQEYFHKMGGSVPNPDNKKVFMKPDGGILFLTTLHERIPILIVEDKVQGTNDLLYEQQKPRQATGNAIERGAKNIRGAEMLFSGLDFFPYVLFASGCDFHSTETIAKRIEMMNMGIPNHRIELSPSTSPEALTTMLESIGDSIQLKKIAGKGIASVFVKSHKWDEMKHGASSWTKDERVFLLKRVLDKVFDSIHLPS